MDQDTEIEINNVTQNMSSEEKIEARVWNSIKRKLIYAGITNLLALILLISYIVFEIPDKAINYAMGKMEKNIGGRVSNLNNEIDDTLKVLALVENDIKSAKNTLDKIKSDFLIFNDLSDKDINNTELVLKIIRNKNFTPYRENSIKIIDLKEELDVVSKELKNITQGKSTLAMLKVRSLSLVDLNNKNRMKMFTDKNSNVPTLSLYDKNGVARVSLFENNSGYSGLELRDVDSKHRASFGTTLENSRPELSFKNKNGKKRLSIYENIDSFFGFGLLDDKGNWRYIASSAPNNGDTSIAINDEHSKLRLKIFESSEAVGITLKDRDQNNRLSLTTENKLGLPNLNFLDMNGDNRLSIYQNDTGFVGTKYTDVQSKSQITVGTSNITGGAMWVSDKKGVVTPIIDNTGN